MSEEGSSSEECSRKGSRLMVEERGLKGGLHRRFEAVREEAGRRGPKGELKEGRCSSPIMSECTAAMVSNFYISVIMIPLVLNQYYGLLCFGLILVEFLLLLQIFYITWLLKEK